MITAILSASVPTLMVVLALILNRSDYHQLRDEIRREIADLRTQQHNDMLRLYELFGEHSQRLAKLETRVNG